MSGWLQRVSDVPLALVVGAQRRSWDLRSRLADQRGQTSSEYLLIAGIAVLIIIAVLGVFRTQLKTAATNIMKNLTTSTK